MQRVFVTSQLMQGNFGGIAAADAICQADAAAASLPGTYLAWLSDSTTSPTARMTHSTNDYVLVDGTVVAHGWTGLTSGSILAPINLTESGGPAPAATGTPAPYLVFTGTFQNGTGWPNGHCSNWTSNSVSYTGIGGVSNSTDGRWSAGASGSICPWMGALYCVQQ